MTVIRTALESRQQIAELLKNPTWSVGDLFIKDPNADQAEKPTPKLLAKLLNQAGLNPVDGNIERQNHLLKEMENQLTFVEHIHNVDTTGLEPLVRIGAIPHTLSLEKMLELEQDQPAVAAETVGVNQWNPTGLATKKSGDFYMLEEGLRHED
jgi:Glu-tRNAGln amidotransferase C subunit